METLKRGRRRVACLTWAELCWWAIPRKSTEANSAEAKCSDAVNLKRDASPEKVECPVSGMDPEGETPWAGPALIRLAGVGRIEALRA
jgi:hypothetical protein